MVTSAEILIDWTEATRRNDSREEIPVSWTQRIEYKLAVLIYRCLHGLHCRTSPRVYFAWLTLTRDNACGRHRHRHSSFLQRSCSFDRAFYMAAARISNKLPFVLTSASTLSKFRRQLKTLLCTRSYHDSFHRTWQTCFHPVPRTQFFDLTLLGVLAVILTLHHLNQFFDEWANKWIFKLAPERPVGYQLMVEEAAGQRRPFREDLKAGGVSWSDVDAIAAIPVWPHTVCLLPIVPQRTGRTKC